MDTLVLEKPTTTSEELIEKLYQTEGKAEIIKGEIVEFMSTGDAPASRANASLLKIKVFG